MQDIAIVGFSIKFPGDGDTPEGFWSMLAEKQCVMEEWPTERFNLEAFAGRSSKVISPKAPLQFPTSGPNYLTADDRGSYEVHIL